MQLTGQIVLRNARIVVPLAVVQATAYFTLNHFPPFPSRTLPLTWIDYAIPFLPWTMWPYLLMMFGPTVLALSVRQPAVFRQALHAYILGYVVTYAFHAFWPTHCERPSVGEDGTFQTWAYATMMVLDSPQSCFPSAHIVGPAILCWAFWRDGYRLGRWLLLAFPFFSLTILTTKQHYVWDLLGGYVLVALAIGFSYAVRWRTERPQAQG